MSKSANSEIIIMLQRKNKELESTVKTLKAQVTDMKKGESGAEGKIKALNEIHA
jgi:cell division protein FtsB